MPSKGVITVVAITLCSVAALVCFVMSIVFSFKIDLVYHEPIVNVDGGVFYLRCDVANSGPYLQSLLDACGAPAFIIPPRCVLLWSQSYWYQTFAYGSVAACPTGYLSRQTSRVDLGINLVALAGAMMLIGGILFAIPVVIVLWECMART